MVLQPSPMPGFGGTASLLLRGTASLLLRGTASLLLHGTASLLLHGIASLLLRGTASQDRGYPCFRSSQIAWRRPKNLQYH